MNKKCCGAIIVMLLASTSCNSGHGTDSLFVKKKPLSRVPISDCTTCHNSANSPLLDPLVTNGSGTRGKHIKHYQQRAIACERCHDGYLNAATHMNGAFDTGDQLVSLISMSITGPSGSWINDAGPGTGSCSGVACHGTETVDWYGTNAWTTPACGTCHVSGYSAALDPAVGNGTPPAGRHGKHVTSRSIGCERCHYQYPASTSHANGRLDTPDPAVNILQFNIVAPSGLWSNDTGPQTGQCSTVSCHGVDTLDWYGASIWTLPGECTTCHAGSFSSALDPLLTNGSGLSGKHVRHVTSFSFACPKCHLGYSGLPSHASGVMDTQDPSVMIMAFDTTNPTGTWVSDTGAQTGACSSLFCHSGNTDWYTLAGVTLPACGVCHVSQIGARRQVMGVNGDFGANPATLSHHVTNGPGSDPVTDQCLVCHDMGMHIGGTVRIKNADTGAIIDYSSAAPSTLELFCLSCHDTTGALSTHRSGGTPTAPFIDGSTLGAAPYRMSAEIATHWAKSYGHRQQGVTCVGNGTANTGCHGNGHGTGFVGLLARNLTLPSTKSNWYATSDEPDYDLCFTCHASYSRVTKEAILGMRTGGNYQLDLAGAGVLPAYAVANIQTLFRDVNLGTTGRPYDDPAFFGSAHENLHMYHVQIGPAWIYRDSIPSSIVCISCHNVHGSETQWGWVHDSLLFSHVSGSGGDQYGRIGAVLNTLGSYPTSCTFNCHNIFGTTSSWFEPSDE
jgi:hypothetical protein